MLQMVGLQEQVRQLEDVNEDMLDETARLDCYSVNFVELMLMWSLESSACYRGSLSRTGWRMFRRAALRRRRCPLPKLLKRELGGRSYSFRLQALDAVALQSSLAFFVEAFIAYTPYTVYFLQYQFQSRVS